MWLHTLTTAPTAFVQWFNVLFCLSHVFDKRKFFRDYLANTKDMTRPLSFLPSDEVIFERSKRWSNFLSRIIEDEDHNELCYDDISSDVDDDESVSELDENHPVNALVKAKNFEASSSSSSDEFDVENLLNQTLPVIEERKRQWKESGMDRVLDTFDLKAITDKVGSWLKKTRLKQSMTPNSSLEDAQIMHFENHQIHFNSDDSLQSADTAKYILSSRKPRAASCTTMTIKRFRYRNGKAKGLQMKHGYSVDHGLDGVFNKRCIECLPTSKSQIVARAMSEVPVRPMFGNHMVPTDRNKAHQVRINDPLPEVLEKGKRESVPRLKSRHRKRRSDTSRKRSVSSSSSSSSYSNCSNSHTKPKFRRIVRKTKKNNETRARVNRTFLTTSSSDCNLSSKRASPPENTSNQEACKPLASGKEEITIQTSNETCFLPEGIVNSTALSNTKTDYPVSTKACHLSPISSKSNSKTKLRINLKKLDFKLKFKENERIEEEPEASSIPSTQGPDRKIIVYTPQNKATHHKSISNGTFKLTVEHLRKTIGEKAARRFITFKAQEFPWEFDSNSTVYFKLPTESENSGSNDDSDEEDILNMFGKQGELIEQPAQDV